MPKKWKLQQVLVYSLAVIVWVNNFQTSDSNSFFCDSNDIARSSNTSGGWAYKIKTIESQRSSWGAYRTFVVLTALQIEDNRHWPVFRGLSSPPSTNTREPWPSNGAKAPLEAHTGLRKASTETKLVTLEQGTQWNVMVYWASNPFLVKL